jgi:hypothetical protein
LVYGLIELATKRVEGLVMLYFGTSNLGQKFRLFLLQFFREAGETLQRI